MNVNYRINQLKHQIFREYDTLNFLVHYDNLLLINQVRKQEKAHDKERTPQAKATCLLGKAES